MKIKVLFILIMLAVTAGSGLQSQTISPQVINAAGDHRQVGTSGIYITDNVGEPFTETLGPNGGVMITQGFIQPDVVLLSGFVATVKVNNVSCLDKNDGEITIDIQKAPQAASYKVVYNWTPSTVCPNSTCFFLDSLMAQTYSVQMLITYTTTVGSVKTDTINRTIPVAGSTEICKIKVYSGITANGDGSNDVFTIDNIEEFPDNKIMIFNRWGKEVANIKNYNNTTNYWPTKDKLDNLLSTTYFYIIDLGDGSKPIKGWVELIKN
jgi:gliding motility-associated-like protein